MKNIFSASFAGLIRCCRFLYFICYFAFFFLFFSCKKETHPIQFTPAFYHWQTNLHLTTPERQLIDSLEVKKIYAKFFDIDINEKNEPAPQAVIDINWTLLNNLDIIPAVFITNRTFKNISPKNIEKLADNIFIKINELYGHPPSAVQRLPSEFQFDCDWTNSTRENYFYFLNYFKTLTAQPSSVAATIRLHQLKYPNQTGVPPVDKGMLMFYNMGDLENWETDNSILDLKIAESYLPPIHRSPFTTHHYPLPLDLALPIFKWGVIFRNNELVYLINDLGKEELQDTSRFINICENRFEVKKSTYLEGYYLYGGDLIRLEKTSPELLNSTANLISDRFYNLSVTPKKTERIVSFYHLDSTTLAYFHEKELKKILEQLNAN